MPPVPTRAPAVLDSAQQLGSSHIDSDYLNRGLQGAIQRGLLESDHPVLEQDIVALVKKQYGWAQSNLMRVYARTIEAWLWFIGQHHLRVDDRRMRFVTNEQAVRIPRPTINLCLEKVESVAGDLNKGIVTGHVIPNSNAPYDRLGADVAERIRQFKWDADRMDELQQMLVLGTVVAGDMFTLTEIDEDANEAVEIDIPLPDGSTTKAKLTLADAKTRLLMGIQIFFNPGATCAADARVRHVHVLQGVEALKEQYPHIRDHVGDSMGDHPLASWQWRLQEMMLHEISSSGMASAWNRGSGQFNSFEKQIVVHHVEFAPSRLYPEGRLFLVAGSGVMYGGPLPLAKSLITQSRYTPIPGSPWSLGLVHPLISLNRHLESAVAQNTLARKVQAVPFWLAPTEAKGSFTEADLMANVGAIYKYKPGPRGEKPEFVQGRHPADAGYVADMQMFIQEFFERVSGSKQVLVGERPQGISAGIALRQLIQRASVRFAPKVSHLHRHHEEMETHRLYAIQRSPAWTVPRRVSLPGRGSRRALGYFRASDMRDNYVYRIEAEPKAIQDEVSKAQTVVDLVGMGAINIMDPRNRIRIRELMGVGDEKFVDESAGDIRKAESLLAALEDGEEVQIGPYDNVAIHFMVTVDYMKTSSFENSSEDIRMRIEEHARELQERMVMMQQGAMFKEARMEAMADATAGGEPEPPPGVPRGIAGAGGGESQEPGAPPGAAPPGGGPPGRSGKPGGRGTVGPTAARQQMSPAGPPMGAV